MIVLYFTTQYIFHSFKLKLQNLPTATIFSCSGNHIHLETCTDTIQKTHGISFFWKQASQIKILLNVTFLVPSHSTNGRSGLL